MFFGLKFRSILFLILITLTILFSRATLSSAKEYTQKQVLEDINFLVSALKRNHPNIYAHISPKRFNAQVAKIKKRVKKRENYYSALTRIQQILAMVCDEHTSAKVTDAKRLRIGDRVKKLIEEDPDSASGWLKNAPFFLYEYFGENLIVTENEVYLDNRAITYNKHALKSINGIPAPDIKKFLHSVSHADGCAENGMLFTRFGNLMDRIILSEFLGLSEKFKMRVHGEKNETPREYTVEGKSLTQTNAARYRPGAYDGRSELLKQHNFNLKELDFVDTRRKSSDKLGIMVGANADKSIYYIYSYAFLDDEGQTKRTNKLLRELLKNNPKHVILDLTDNPGGRLSVASHLLSYFLRKSHRIGSHVRMRNPSNKRKNFEFFSKEYEKSYRKKSRQFRRARKRHGQYKLRFLKKSFGNPDYRGDLTVLVGPRTHSAGTVVASVLKRKRNARLVGYVNAGSTKTSCFGASGIFTMPNTKIPVTIPDTCYDRPRNKNNKGDTLVPDIEVDPLGAPAYELNTRILKAALDDILTQPIGAEAKAD